MHPFLLMESKFIWFIGESSIHNFYRKSAKNYAYLFIQSQYEMKTIGIFFFLRCSSLSFKFKLDLRSFFPIKGPTFSPLHLFFFS